MRFFKFVERYFGLVLTLGLVTGLLAGQFIDAQSALALSIGNQYIVVGLFVLLLLSMLKVNLWEFFQDFKRAKFLTEMTINKLIVLPLVFFGVSSLFLPEQYLPGILLATAVPAAVATPGLLLMLKGDVKIGLVIAVITNLLAPFTIPLMVRYTIGADIELDLVSMFLFLVFLVFIPFITSLVLERFAPGIVKKINKYTGALVAIDLFFFMIAVIAPHAQEIVGNLRGSIIAFLIVLATAVGMHLFALIPFTKREPGDAKTSIIVMAYANFGLAIVIASQYFDTVTVLVTTFYEFAWAIGLIFIQKIFAKN